MRTFYDGEKEIQFVITQYKRYLHEYQHRCEVELQKRVTLQSIDMHIAEVLHMDYETVKKWHNTKKSGNGVGDLETIKKLATILGINYKALVKEVGVMKENNGSSAFISKSMISCTSVWPRVTQFRSDHT